MSWLNGYEIDKGNLEAALNRNEVGAIEFVLLMKSEARIETVLSLFASGHGGIGKEKYLEKLVSYLIKVGILRKKEK